MMMTNNWAFIGKFYHMRRAHEKSILTSDLVFVKRFVKFLLKFGAGVQQTVVVVCEACKS